jgi:hypothetical protein
LAAGFLAAALAAGLAAGFLAAALAAGLAAGFLAGAFMIVVLYQKRLMALVVATHTLADSTPVEATMFRINYVYKRIFPVTPIENFDRSF